MNDHEKPWHIGESDAPLPPTIPTGQDEFNEKGDNSLKFCVEQYKNYGPIFRIMRLDRPLTVLAGPDANVFVARLGTEILSEKAFWQEFAREYVGKKVGGREGDANRQRRALLSRSYSRGRILDRLPELFEMTRQHTLTWQAGQSIVFYPWIQELVAEQLGQLLTHYGPGNYVPDLDTFLSTMMAATMSKSQASSVLQAPAYLQARQRVFELGRSIVAAHRNDPPQDRQPDLVDDMIEAAARAGRVVKDEQMAPGALGPFLAGLHTVTTASCYLLYALLTHSEILLRVMAEIDAVLTQGELTWDALKTMHALHGAAMEALRLYPVSIGHHCQAIQPFTFAGYRVEAGEDVFVAMTVSHFLPELFPHPETFDSDRYSDPHNEHRQRGAYALFGSGDHACLGSGIAEVQLMGTIAALLFLYQLELDPPDYELRPLEVSRSSVREQLRVRIMNRRQD